MRPRLTRHDPTLSGHTSTQPSSIEEEGFLRGTLLAGLMARPGRDDQMEREAEIAPRAHPG